MKQLIISNYDGEYGFSYVVIDNLTEIESGNKSEQLSKYDLYAYDWYHFDSTLIDFDNNEKIQEFDMIIVCDNGSIDVYNHYCDVEKNEGEEDE